MSEKARKPEPRRASRGRTAVISGVAAALASLTAGFAAGTQHGEAVAQPTNTEIAERNISKAIALGHTLKVLDGGKAAVELEDGTDIVIDNPILDPETGTVSMRTMGSDAGEITVVQSFSPGEGGVEGVSYFGDTLYSDGERDFTTALHETTPVNVERAEGLSGYGNPDGLSSGSNYFDSVDSPGKHIAQGTV